MPNMWQKYRLRQLRRYTLWRAFRSRRQLEVKRDRTPSIAPDSILCVMCVRNEAVRLPYFMRYYRNLGVDHFLIVDNASSDGTPGFLADQPDVSVWSTDASYKASRFGLDWTTWLQMKYARGKWCLTLDADELLVFSHQGTRDLRDLTGHMDEVGQKAFGAIMLDLYPKGPINQAPYEAGEDPRCALGWLDVGPYRAERQMPKENLWVQGGVRERVFFHDEPRKGPTLNKLPLVKWNPRYAYVNSTHSILPSRLNYEYDGPYGSRLSGALLHTKFLNLAVEKSKEDKIRKQHFARSESFETYYDQVISGPNLWHAGSVQYESWEQLEALGLMSRGEWL